MEIKDRKTRRALRRLARLSVAADLVARLRNVAREHVLAAFRMKGITILPTPKGEKPLRCEGLTIKASRPSDVTTLNREKLVERFNNPALGITLDQLLNCVTGYDAKALTAVFGEGLIDSKPSLAAPTVSFTADADEAVSAAAQRFARRIGGEPQQELIDFITAEAEAAKAEAAA